MDSLGSIAQLEALRAVSEANRVIGILTGEVSTKQQLGGYGPEDVLVKYLFEVTDIYPRDRIVELQRGRLFVRIFYSDDGETFDVELTHRKMREQ